MKKRSHIIGRQIFEVGFSSREKTHELQGRISSAFNTRVAGDIGELFDRMIPDNKLITVDSLTIDIGSIPFDFFDDQLSGKITEKLEHELLLLLLHDNSVPGTDPQDLSADPVRSFLKLLEYFLLRGTLPWWAGGEPLITPSDALELLLEQAAPQLKTLFTDIGRKDYVRSRLVFQFPEQHIRSVISILEPAEASFIFEYHTEVVSKQREEEFIKSEETEFSKAIWVFILTYILVDRGTHFNRKQFVKSTLMSMSAHFNIAFPELLALFASALRRTSFYGNTDSLQAIILELSVESDDQALNTSAVQEPGSVNSAASAGFNADILGYYLTFGSLPWWSQGWQQQELADMLTELIRKLPNAAAALIRSTGTREYTRGIIVRTFGENIVKEIIRLIEPDHAEFIFDYVDEMKAVQIRQPALSAPVNEFSTAVWQFILEYLLVDRGSEFNQMMFLESNIRKLASHYNVKYHELLVFMVNSIAVSHHSSSRHVSLLQGLTSLYKIAETQQEGNQPVPPHSGTDAEKQADVVPKLSLKNILYFWLRFGHLPWWADKPAGISSDKLLEQFIQSSPQDAILFFKYAGLKPNTRRRMVYQIPAEVLLKLFRMLPDGMIAGQSLEELLTLISANTRLRFPEKRIPQEILLLSAWNVFGMSFYEKFDNESFLRYAVADLAAWLQIPVATFVDSFRKIGRSGEFTVLYKKFFGRFRIEHERREINTGEAPEFDIKKLIATHLAGDASNDDQIAGEALVVLKYFLQHGRIPESYRMSSEYAINLFLKKLLLLLLQERSAALEAVLNSSDYPALHLIRLHDIFFVTSSVSERNMNGILSASLEKNIRVFLMEREIPEIAVTELIGKYLTEPGAASADLVRQLLKSRAVSMRLAYYYRNDTVLKLIDNNWIRGWDPQAISDLKAFQVSLSGLITGNLEKDRFELLFRAFVFLMIGGGLRINSIADFIHYFFKFLYERDTSFLMRLSSSLSEKIPASTAFLPGIVTDIEAELQRYAGYERKVIELNEQLSASDLEAKRELGLAEDEQHRILEKELKELEKEDKKVEEELDDAGTIYINNAGLVLLHPFIPTYFNRLGMIEKGDFISEEARHRAVHLLQYLVYGTDQHEEHELVLNKILCNMPLEEAIEAGISMTDTEKTVSSELLQAVLSQWEKLKNTTAEGLQTSFLQRKGGLVRNEESWNLRVEQKGYDVLLQTLPWGLGMIKTSWMNEFIYVEWM